MTLERIRVVPEPVDVYQEFARHFISELQEVQDSEKTLNLILPIGPTSQYPLITAQINYQRLSMKNCRIILMDEYLDWHGRPLVSSHHLSFRRQFEEFLSTVNPELRIDDEHWVIPDPFDIYSIDNFISLITSFNEQSKLVVINYIKVILKTDNNYLYIYKNIYL